MSERRDGPRSGDDEFGGFLAEVERSMAEALAQEEAPPRAAGPDPLVAAREEWLSPDRFVGDFVDLEARLAEEPA